MVGTANLARGLLALLCQRRTAQLLVQQLIQPTVDPVNASLPFENNRALRIMCEDNVSLTLNNKTSTCNTIHLLEKGWKCSSLTATSKADEGPLL